ncbi:MAG: hypothetical protein U0M20_08610 [Christensenellales bacterium]|nr:hypothetical protein [Christensenellales bacterium]
MQTPNSIRSEGIMEYDRAFWSAADELISRSRVVIDRPKGTSHPKYPDFIYRVDYGYLEGTSSMDGGGIDVWAGTDGTGCLNAVMCIIDLAKMDSEIKLMIGCTEEEIQIIYDTHNETGFMKGLLIRRPRS